MKNKFFGEKNQNYLFLGMSLLIVINFYTIFYLYTLNLPLTDDVYDIFYYAIANQENSGFINKLKLLIWQYDEHKLVFNHLVYLSSFAIFNKINLIFINSIGLIALPALLFFIFHALNKNQKPPFAFMILAAMIFNFSHNEVTFWAMATLNAYFIPLMAVICFYFLTKTKHIHIIFASSLMFVSVISMPNGVLIFLLGVPLIIMAQEKKNILIFLCYWLAAGIFALLIFFTGMEGFKSLSQIESSQLINLYRQSSLIILGMLVLLGGLPFI